MEKEFQIEMKAKEIADRVSELNSDNIKVIEDVCIVYDKYLKEFKDYWFLYRVIVPKDSEIWVMYYDKTICCKSAEQFLKTISEWLYDSVVSWDNLAIQEKHLNILINVWEHELYELEKY